MFNKDPRGSRFLIDVKEKSMARWQHNYFDKIPRDNCKNLYIYLYIYRFHFIFLETVSIEIDVMFLFWCENDPGINRMICQSNKSITRVTIIEYVLIGYLILFFILPNTEKDNWWKMKRIKIDHNFSRGVSKWWIRSLEIYLYDRL